MDQKRAIRLYNSFNRIHSQFSAIKKQYVCEDNGRKLFPSELQVLALIGEFPGINVSDIASRLYMTKSGASQILKKLNSKGLIDKVREAGNERVVLLNLTEKGQEILQRFSSLDDGAFSSLGQLLSSFSKDETEVIEKFLKELENLFSQKLE